MPKGTSTSPKKKKKLPMAGAADGGASVDSEGQDAAEAAQGAALLAEAMSFRKPLYQRVSLNLEALKVAHPFVVFTPAAAVTNELKGKAAAWQTWKSSDHEPTFSFTYEAEERIVCTKGKAIVTPTDAAIGEVVFGALCQEGAIVAPITVGPGDAVIFMEGFTCKWEVVEPMEYQWVYTDATIQFGWPHVWCDSEKELSTTRGRAQLSQR